eukprot:TRINITY_DN22820_c0_g1_i1.p1 TRINITY_DN22820_c0_g1~~TRINITY_DN22820_c0_g1_i1.p1  ORF type:complete len:443 (-),score=79.69 TRINITY_DN22820_c0_g1_i1:67-1371(-)
MESQWMRPPQLPLGAPPGPWLAVPPLLFPGAPAEPTACGSCPSPRIFAGPPGDALTPASCPSPRLYAGRLGEPVAPLSSPSPRLFGGAPSEPIACGSGPAVSGGFWAPTLGPTDAVHGVPGADVSGHAVTGGGFWPAAPPPLAPADTSMASADAGYLGLRPPSPPRWMQPATPSASLGVGADAGCLGFPSSSGIASNIASPRWPLGQSSGHAATPLWQQPSTYGPGTLGLAPPPPAPAPAVTAALAPQHAALSPQQAALAATTSSIAAAEVQGSAAPKACRKVGYRARVEWEREIQEAFRTFDPDDVGSVDLHELRAALKALGLPTRKPEVLAALREQGCQETDRIDFEAFRRILLQRYEAQNPLEASLDAFRLFDVDGRGRLGLGDLRRVSNELGQPLADRDLRRMVQTCGKQRAGDVDESEFARVMASTSLW